MSVQKHIESDESFVVIKAALRAIKINPVKYYRMNNCVRAAVKERRNHYEKMQ